MASRFLVSDIDDANAGPKAVGWTVAELLRAWASDAINIADLVVGGRLDRSADGQHSSYELGAPYYPVILDVERLEPAQDNLIMTVSGIPLATLVSPSGVAYIATRKEVKADANGHVQLVAGPQMLSHREGDRRNANIFMPNVVFRAFEDKSGRVQIGKGPIVWQQLWPLYKPKPRDHAGTRILGDEAVKHLARHPGDAIWLAEVPAQVKGKEPLRVLFVSTLYAVKGGSTSSAASVHHGTATHSLAHEALSLASFRPEYTHRQRLIYRLPNYA
ncbi:uncharacterized protein JCM10292_003310 [Rhodotorula paludigena]|uniref:uncharacterized protein n=1 Tax=Rhodotorula paludigena TaxID=86838 RepID=UPI00316F460C